MKKHTTIRLTDEAKGLLKSMAKEKGVTMTAILEMLIRKGFRR